MLQVPSPMEVQRFIFPAVGNWSIFGAHALKWQLQEPYEANTKVLSLCGHCRRCCQAGEEEEEEEGLENTSRVDAMGPGSPAQLLLPWERSR